MEDSQPPTFAFPYRSPASRARAWLAGAQVGYGDTPTSNQRRVRMMNTKREKEISCLNFTSPVLAVKLNRQRLVVVLETTIYIYDISNLNLTHTIAQTPRNARGVCALASNNSPRLLDAAGGPSCFAYPGAETTGLVYVYDVANHKPVTTIEAHTTPVACMAFSPSGARLATASQRGTVIRVFALPGGEPLFEFRRGTSACTVLALAFSADEQLLAVSSDHPTVHVFRLDAAAAAAAASAAPAGALAGAPAETAAPASMAAAASSWTSSFLSTVVWVRVRVLSPRVGALPPYCGSAGLFP